MRRTRFAALATAAASVILAMAASVSVAPETAASAAVDPVLAASRAAAARAGLPMGASTPDMLGGAATTGGGSGAATAAPGDHLVRTARGTGPSPTAKGPTATAPTGGSSGGRSTAAHAKKKHPVAATATRRAVTALTATATATPIVGGTSTAVPPVTPPTDTTTPPATTPPVNAGSTTGFGLAAAPGDFVGTPAQTDAIMADYRSEGLTWLRTPISWLTVQSARNGPYDWSHYDTVMASAARHGLRVIAIIGGTPAWARAANCTGRDGWEQACPPLADVAGYSAINATMAARYPGLVMEVWNEPNLKSFWSPAPDPAAYTQVLIAAYNAIKQASPDTTVLSAGLTLGWNNPGRSMNPVDFLSAVYANGGGGHFDGVAWHPYLFHAWGAAAALPGQVTVDSSWFQMYGTNPSARSLMIAHGDGDKKIWVTEMGANTEVSNQIYATEAEQAAIVTRAVQLWASYPWAGAFNFYTYQDGFQPGASGNSEGYFGLWRANHTPKPAVAALRAAVAATH